MIAVTVQHDLPAARVPYGDARLGVLVARYQLPGAPCSGHEQVQTSRRSPRWARDGRHDDPTLLGAADLAGQRCLIWVRGHLDRATTCKVTVHELMHWDGYADNEPGLPIMREGGGVFYDGDQPGVAPDWPYAPCEVPR